MFETTTHLGRVIYSICLLAVLVTATLSNDSPASASTISNLNDFNNTSDLTDFFNDDGTPAFTGQATGGINNSGSINVPIGSNEIWTTKQGYSVSGNAGDVYTFSAYFKVAMNSGWGNLGFTVADTNTISTGDGQPSIGLGANFHGGGGAFYNNGSATTLSWPPDLVLGNWYWMTFEVTAQGSNTFDLKLQIWNTDATGAIGTMKTEKTLNGVTNTQLGSASTIHAFFGAAGSRMNTIDNFGIDLQGSTFVEEGAPVVLPSTLGSPADTSISYDGNVTDDQGAAITARGVCWSTAASPTVSGSCTTDGTGVGTFSSSVAGLTPGTSYYIRVYATNSVGTSYGPEETFTTTSTSPAPSPPPAPSTDSDGVDNDIEAAAPNGGDGNNDGTPDNQQQKVASIKSPQNNNYVTVEATSCTGVNALTVSGESVTHGEDDSAYTYPSGLLDFTLTGCSAGGSEVITQYFYGNFDLSTLVVRKYDPSTRSYTTVSGATLSALTINGAPVIKVQYTVVDGGDLDTDKTVNGVIVDPIGLGVLAATSLSDTGTSGLAQVVFGSMVPVLVLLLNELATAKRYGPAKSKVD